MQNQEWRELSERYEQMSDEELQNLANEAYELTDMAKELLQGEIARRSLKIKLLTEPPAVAGGAKPPVVDDDDFDPESLDLVTATRVWDMEDARRVKTICNDAGVPSYFGPNHVEDVEAVHPLFEAEAIKALKRNFEVGIEVKTPRHYQQRFLAALRYADAQKPPTDIDKPEPDYAAECPKCHSPEIVFEGLDGTVPDPTDAAFKWHCDACGHNWNDDGVEEERRA